MFCTQCGQQNPENYKFCSRCGNPLKRIENPKPQIFSQSTFPGDEKEIKAGETTNISSPEEPVVDNGSGFHNQNIKNVNHHSQEKISEEKIEVKVVEENKTICEKGKAVFESEENETVAPPQNQYDEDGNLILPVYEENKKTGRTGIILGLIAAAIITGAGIWGYSAYVASSEKKAKEYIYQSWLDFINNRPVGQILSTLAIGFTNQSLTDFQESGFHTYLENKVPDDEEISIYRLDVIANGAVIKYDTPVSIENIMTSELRDLYKEAVSNGYENSNYYQPIKELNQSGVFTFGEIFKNDMGGFTIPYYPGNYYKDGEGRSIVMINENGEWKISDITKIPDSFNLSMNEYLTELNAPKEITYNGNVYTPAGPFPIKLFIDYSSSPIKAIYTNLNYNVTLDLVGNKEDDFIELENNGNEKVSFKLQRNNDNSLTGTFSATTSSGEVKTYDVVLKPTSDEEDSPMSSSASIVELAGKIDGKYAVHMELNLDTRKGTYYYDRNGNSNILNLVVEEYVPGQSLVLKEYDNQGKYCGKWDGIMKDGEYIGEGEFLDKTMPFHLKIY